MKPNRRRRTNADRRTNAERLAILFNRRPTNVNFRRIGRIIAAELPTCCSLTAVAKAFSLSKQAAWHHTTLALGKLTYRLHKKINQ
jgi:hypothetical protein